MKLYSRYIFHKVLIGFLAFNAILISLIWFSRAIAFVKYVTENGIELSQFFYLFILILPWLLLFIVPVSLFAAILIIYNRMIVNNELTILKNSGLTKISISKPAIILAFIASLFCFLTSFYLMPLANKELRISRINFENNYANLSFSPKTFETLKNLTIYAQNRDNNNRLSGILLHDNRSEKYSITITAKSGNIVSQDRSALLYMESGTIQKLNYLDKKSEILNFDHYVFNLAENRKIDSKMHWKPKELYMHELLNPPEILKDYEAARNITEINQRLTYPLLPIIFTLIALSCILHGSFSRKGNFYNIALAIILAASFFIITMSIYNLIDTSPKFIPLLYANFIIFFTIGMIILTSNYRKKR